MNRYLPIFFVAFSIFFTQLSAQQQTTAKLSPHTRQLLLQLERSGTQAGYVPGYVYKKDNAGRLYLSALIKTLPSFDPVLLRTFGVKTGTIAGSVLTAQIPVDVLKEVTKLPGISYIQLDEPIAPFMDSARKVARVDSVHGGYAPLPMPYTGKGVIVGILDAGFDYNHPSLFDTSGNRYRVVKVWEQKSIGIPPSGYAYGNELPDTTAFKITGTDKATFSHGAHVAGIAAGSGMGSPSKEFMGMAFESDLVLVGITPDSTQWLETGVSDIIDGMSYVYNYATSKGKPAVVNLSWGTTLGPHDGTSLFSEACDNLTGIGKLFVCSAGNNGSDNVHLKKTFTTTDTMVKTIVNFASSMNRTWVDIWGDTSEQFCISLSLYNGTTPVAATPVVCLDNNTHHFELIGSDGDTCFIDVTTVDSDFNFKPRIFFKLYSKTANTIMLSAKGNAGTINMWNGFVANGHGYYGPFSVGLPGTTAGDQNMTTGDVADTKSAVAVGSFASKVTFTNIGALTVSYSSYVLRGRRAPYSSKGPTADGRIKPDITGPGLMIASASNVFDTSYSLTGSNWDHVVCASHSASDGKDHYYAMMTGTSMSSPAVAGIVALMLQANPGLNPVQVQDIIATTAYTDMYTGTIPATGNNSWGHGKINAFAAVNKALTTTGIHSSSTINPLDCLLFPNPNEGTFELKYSSRKSDLLKVEIFDITGKMVRHEIWPVDPGANRVTLECRQFDKGIYFTRVSSAEGSVTIKTIVQ